MHLNAHSYFSLRYGTLSPEKLVDEAVARAVTVLALTDINNSSAAFPFVQACRKAGIKPVLGIEFRCEGRFRYLGIARNREGWRELCRHLSDYQNTGAIGERAPHWDNAWVVYRKCPVPVEELRDSEWIGIRPGELNALYSSPLRHRLDKLVAFAPVTFLGEDGCKVHQLLQAIEQNVVLGKLDKLRCAARDEFFHSPRFLKTCYEPYPQIISNTIKLLDTEDWEWKADQRVNRQSFTGTEQGDFELLRKLATNGCRRRYGPGHLAATERVEKELRVIRQLGFAAYFLITWDIVRYAQTAGYHHVGRGSGANSIVAFCLYITDVDPLELDLYFERFINPHRSSPPDFDIDFSWDQRDDVIDYILRRYGKEHTALIATYNTFKGKSIIRELGKVFGLPKADIDAIVNEPLAREKHHHFSHYIFRYGKMIEGFPNYLSIHAGGIVISEEPIHYYTALQQMPKGFPITHFDMHDAEDMGFHKYDILSQRGLGHIKDAVSLIRQNRGEQLDIHAIERIKRDPKVKAQLSSGHCIGCFYIESPAMRGLLTKLRCDNYIHLVAASSIIRPGVAKSGMMREYIQRFHDPASFSYLHPVFKKHLSETFGVMVYQEDVMKIVHHFAGLDLDESDILRRIMTGKRKSSDTFERLRKKYFEGCKERGYSRQLAEEVWRQIASFSGYSFCKAHSASFAVESFQSLFLKAYYPIEFMAAVINNFGGFYRTEVYVHEARMCGATIEAPCVNHSSYLTTVKGTSLYLGFVHIQSLEQKLARSIMAERERNGPYESFQDFVQRVEIPREQLVLLIRINAFRFTGQSKYELMWEKTAAMPGSRQPVRAPVLFKTQEDSYTLPVLEESPGEQAFDEIELLGFPLCSPFELLETPVKGTVMAEQLGALIGKRVSMLGYFVTRKHVTTVNGKHMNFGTFIDEQGRFFDTTHFPAALEKSPFRGPGIYAVKGRVVEDFGFPGVEVQSMEKLPYKKDQRY